jgi:hypothetical protein
LACRLGFLRNQKPCEGLLEVPFSQPSICPPPSNCFLTSCASYVSYVPWMKMMKTPSDDVYDAFYLFYYVFCVLWATVNETDSVFFF